MLNSLSMIKEKLSYFNLPMKIDLKKNKNNKKNSIVSPLIVIKQVVYVLKVIALARERKRERDIERERGKEREIDRERERERERGSGITPIAHL